MLIEQLKTNIKNKNIRLVFPETHDERVFQAAKRLAKEKLCVPVMIGKASDYEQVEGLEFVDPKTFNGLKELKASVIERRQGKSTAAEVDQLLLQPTFFGTALVYTKQAHGLIAGATQSTGDTVRPALQLIKTKPTIAKTFGYFIMLRDDKVYLMGDCAINPEPEAKDLAEFAVELSSIANSYGIEPKIAMLSFSTKGSANTPHTQKVQEATAIAKQLAPSVMIDGEMQFDAAVDPRWAK
jgi:phosphate acetyltransferase